MGALLQNWDRMRTRTKSCGGRTIFRVCIWLRADSDIRTPGIPLRICGCVEEGGEDEGGRGGDLGAGVAGADCVRGGNEDCGQRFWRP